MTEMSSDNTSLSMTHPDVHEDLERGGLVLQLPHEFRDDFVSLANSAHNQVGFETMQFEVSPATQPIYDAIIAAKKREIPDVRFHYDRVALRHIRAPEDMDSQAWISPIGRLAIRKGDKPALTKAIEHRDQLLATFEDLDIADPKFRGRGPFKRGGHNHIKLAIADNTAWFLTMNQRAIDYEISNFAIKVTDQEWVDALKDVFNDTEQPNLGVDRSIDRRDQNGDIETRLLLDAGHKRQSLIYTTAMYMAASLQPGDSFTFISQWPPVRSMYGDFAGVLHDKTLTGGVRGTYLLSPADRLHPHRGASAYLQKTIDNLAAHNSNMQATYLPMMTHAKAFAIHRANGQMEALFGTHNLSAWTVRNGTRELAMWSKDSDIVGQIDTFLEKVRS